MFVTESELVRLGLRILYVYRTAQSPGVYSYTRRGAAGRLGTEIKKRTFNI